MVDFRTWTSQKNAPRADVTWTTTAAAAGTFDLAGLDEDETLGIHQTVATASTLNHAWNKRKMAATCISPIAAPARPNLTRIAQFQLGVPFARNQRIRLSDMRWAVCSKQAHAVL